MLLSRSFQFLLSGLLTKNNRRLFDSNVPSEFHCVSVTHPRTSLVTPPQPHTHLDVEQNCEFSVLTEKRGQMPTRNMLSSTWRAQLQLLLSESKYKFTLVRRGTHASVYRRNHSYHRVQTQRRPPRPLVCRTTSHHCFR